jgi:glycerophosphoryl diester phosphodiesterase
VQRRVTFALPPASAYLLVMVGSPPFLCWRTLSALLVGAMTLGGCGFVPPEYPPKLISHRAGAGRFPENSRAAIKAAVARNDWGIEVDVVLTKDEVAILSNDTWLDPERCSRADGSELPPDVKIRIMDLTYDELISGYRCGGKKDPATPDARVVADTHVTLREFLGLVAGHRTILLDIKQDGIDTHDAETYARVVLADFHRRSFITASDPATLRAFNALRPEITTLLVWPHVPPGSNSTLAGLGQEFTRVLGFQEMVQLIEEAEANGIAVAYELADRAALEVVRQSGYLTAVWAPNSEAALRVYCDSTIHYILTDAPERASCHWFSR